MRKDISFLLYAIAGLIVFYLDRITKAWAMEYAVDGITINRFLSLDLVFNRGVTAGMLQSDSPAWFATLSCIIGAIIIGLSLYTCYRWYHGYAIVGEVLTVACATSNLLDRYWFDGVIDFIHVTFWNYSFPIFNGADMCIVLGVMIMFYMHMNEDAT